MMGIFGFLAALILAVLTGYFVFLNQVPVQVNLPFLPAQQAFLHEVILYSAIAGLSVAGLLALGPHFKAFRTIRALRRQLRTLDEQLQALRESSGTPALYSENSLAPARTAVMARGDEEPV
jgi:uncharacterized integral membrane protein